MHTTFYDLYKDVTNMQTSADVKFMIEEITLCGIIDSRNDDVLRFSLIRILIPRF